MALTVWARALELALALTVIAGNVHISLLLGEGQRTPRMVTESLALLGQPPVTLGCRESSNYYLEPIEPSNQGLVPVPRVGVAATYPPPNVMASHGCVSMHYPPHLMAL